MERAISNDSTFFCVYIESRAKSQELGLNGFVSTQDYSINLPQESRRNHFNMDKVFTDDLRSAIEEARKQINTRRVTFQAELNTSCCEDEPLYETNKRTLFHTVSAQPDKIYSCEDIYSILELIDGFYGTQTQTPFALRDLACAIHQAQGAGSLWHLFDDYLSNKSNNTHVIYQLFNKEYGIGEKGKGQKATSLISKFGYFITDWHFPIYDSFVRELLPIIGDKVGCISIPKTKKALKDIVVYITAVDELIYHLFGKTVNPIDYYDALDYVLWRIGKVYHIIPRIHPNTAPSNPYLLLNRGEYDNYRHLCNNARVQGDISIFQTIISDSLLKQCADLAAKI